VGESKRRRQQQQQVIAVPTPGAPVVVPEIEIVPGIVERAKEVDGVSYHLGKTGDALWPLKRVDDGEHRVRDFLTGDYLMLRYCGQLLPRERVRPITAEALEQLAATLPVDPSARFAFDVGEIVFGFAGPMAFGTRGLRAVRDVLEQIERNPELAIEKYSGDPFYSFVIADIWGSVREHRRIVFDDADRLFRKIARERRNDIRALLAATGKNRNGLEPILWRTVVHMVERLTGDTSLPGRGEDNWRAPTSTPLFLFADRIRLMLAEQIRLLGGSDGRLSQLTRDQLIGLLEHAKAAEK
jgi:hypothetical protein